MNPIKKYELDKSWESMRYFLDYRLKFFNFFIASNGVLLTVVLAHLKEENSRVVLSIFAILVSVIMYLIDKRIISLALMYQDVFKKMSEELGFENLVNLKKRDLTRLNLNNLFSILYVLIIITWISLILLIKYNLFVI